MKRTFWQCQIWVAAAVLTTVLATSAHADVALNWSSHLGSAFCVHEEVANGYLGSLRLSSCTSGFGEGEVTLPSDGIWTIVVPVTADESGARDPNDTVEVFINGLHRGTASNTPANNTIIITATVTGHSFTYHFDFASSTSSIGLHQLVASGVASGGPETCAAGETGAQYCLSRECTLVSKDVNGERWSITYQLSDGSVTGNVFRTDGRPPAFIGCNRIASDASNGTFECFGAEKCATAPCPTSKYSHIVTVELPLSFFFPSGDTPR